NLRDSVIFTALPITPRSKGFNTFFKLVCVFNRILLIMRRSLGSAFPLPSNSVLRGSKRMLKAKLRASIWPSIGVWIALLSGQLAAAQEPAVSRAPGTVSLEARLAKVEQLSAEAKS